jgi:hypothetical protein
LRAIEGLPLSRGCSLFFSPSTIDSLKKGSLDLSKNTRTINPSFIEACAFIGSTKSMAVEMPPPFV